MLKTVLIDLQPFMLFYSIIVFMFGMIVAVTGISNPHIGDLKAVYAFKTFMHSSKLHELPGYEYHSVGMIAGIIITVLRISIGDFSFDGLEYE